MHLTRQVAGKARRHEQPGAGPHPCAGRHWHGGESDHRDRPANSHRHHAPRENTDGKQETGEPGRFAGPARAGGALLPPLLPPPLPPTSVRPGPRMTSPALAQVPVLVDNRPGPSAVTRTLDAELLDRATRDDYQQWLSTALAAGGCARPIRLRGTARDIDPATGEVVRGLDTEDLPDKAIYLPCG